MAVINTGVGQCEYVQVGTGTDLVLIHSLLTDKSAFEKVLPALTGHFRVTLMSLPGFGESSPVAAGIEHYSDAVAALFDALELPPETAVLGNGFGGFVVSAFASQHGDRCGRLVLADTGITFPEAGQETFRTMARRVHSDGMEAVLDTAIQRLFPEAYITVAPEQVEQSKSVLRQIDPNAFVTACETLARLDLDEHVKRITNETLVLVGALDAATPPAMARSLADALVNAQFVEIPECGHAPHLQDPDAFIDVVTSFLVR